MSRSLWAFDLKPGIDKVTGQEVLPDVNDIVDGLFVCPQPFPANIVTRSESRAVRVREEWGKMRGLLDDDMQWKSVPEGLKWKDYEPDSDTEDVMDGV